jgi:hypothetical protein
MKTKYKIKYEETSDYINKEQMKECRVMIGLPCYGGNITMETTQGLIRTCQRSIDMGIRVDCYFVANESLIPRGRNRIVAHFLASKANYTHLMFIDVDSEFNGDDVYKLLHFNKDIIGAPVSTKSLPARHVLEVKGAKEGKMNCTADKQIVELSNIGSAFYLIKRRVFEEMINAYPNLHVDPRVPKRELETLEIKSLEGENYPERYLENFYSLYDTGLSDSLDVEVKKDQSKGDVYLSEDYVFAKRWTHIGGKIWIDPRIQVGHVGRYIYRAPCIQNFPKDFWLPKDYVFMKDFI